MLPKNFSPIIQIEKTTLTRRKYVQRDPHLVLIPSLGLHLHCNVAKISFPAEGHHQSQRAKAMPAIAAAPIRGIPVAMARLLDLLALALLLSVEEAL